jgi:hypothetical protein
MLYREKKAMRYTTPDWEEYLRGLRAYSKIEDGLYLGGVIPEPPPGTQAVLNVCQAEDAYTVDANQHDWVDDVYKVKWMRHLMKGVMPFKYADLDWLRRQVEFIDEQRKLGRTVYVHCHEGISRSPFVLAGYLMYRDGITRAQALARIRAKRPVIEPNPGFMKLLRQWQKQLKRRGRVDKSKTKA